VSSTHGSLAMVERVNAIVSAANAWMAARFGDALNRCVSIGLNGSCARGDISAVSDIDYCIIFDCRDDHLHDVNLEELVARLRREIVSSFPEDPFARRFSVFWGRLEDLKLGHYQVGRFPPYDRGLFRRCGRLVAGMEVGPESIHCPTAQEVGRAGVTFLLEEVRVQLDALRFFENLHALSAVRLRELGPVLASKAVLMPVRMLYVLQAENEAQLFVSAEAAVRCTASSHGTYEWWELVESALVWRSNFPESDVGLSASADALKRHARGLYSCCIRTHRQFALDNGMVDAAAELESWVSRLGL
jgi:hypothetical protein